jgi:hypothetical protein
MTMGGTRWASASSSPGAGARRAGTIFRLLIAVLLVLGSLGYAPIAAQDQPDYAGIVIQPGDGTVTYAYVPLDESVSGIELLRRSGVSLLTVGFGALGEGVCKIEETGCEIGPCRTRLCQTGDRNSPYWRYFQQDEAGAWVAAPLGGSATRIEPGEIDGWSWTPDEAGLPVVEVADIPRLAGAEGALNEAHFARYDANGNLVEESTLSSLDTWSYLLVAGILAALAVFALVLRFRPGPAA